MALQATQRRTTCPYCGVGCGVDARLTGGDVIAVSGSDDHPANRGRLCVKGSALHETNGMEGRLLHPVVNGRRATWDEALDRVAGGFANIIDKHGPDAVAFYLSGQLLTEDYYVANKLMKGFIGSANVDTNSRLCMASAVAGYKRAFGADAVPCSYEDLETCDLLVMAGSNAAWTHPVLYQRIEAAKQKRPHMRVVVVDPRRTATCDIADLHLPIRPGTDAFLFVGLLHYLSVTGCLDDDYIRAHTAGFSEALEAAAETDLESLGDTLGVASQTLETFFRWFADTEKTVTFYSQGINQSATGTDKCNAIINCHLATGRIGREGMGPFSITGQPNAMGGREVGGLANQLAAHMNFTPEDIDRVGRFWEAPRMARHLGLKAVDLFDAIERGSVKAVWIMATNPVVSMPDADRVKRALEKCELVVVSDCIAETDTTACADILLPATGWGEKDGTVTNSERRISRQRALSLPAGEARHDWQIVCDLARRMGFGAAFDYRSPRDVFCEHAALSGFENAGNRVFDISGLSALSDTGYENLEPVQWPVNAANPAGRARLFGDGRFSTGDGRARFVAVMPAAPSQNSGGGCGFVMNTGRIRDQWHTMTRTARAPRLLNHIDSPSVSIGPADAARLHITEGDLLEVQNSRGSLRLPAAIDEGGGSGEIFVPMHWNDQYASHARIGALIAPVTDPRSGQPESKYVPVNLRKLPVRRWLQVASHESLDVSVFDFWTKVPLARGFRYRLAVLEGNHLDVLAWARERAGGDTRLEFGDAASGDYRIIAHDDVRPRFMAYLAADRQSLPQGSWLAENFGARLPADRWLLLAGRSAAGSDKGRLICSCFEVGEKEIIRAIGQGAGNPRELGDQLRCGTNCGSCIPELKALLTKTAEGGEEDAA